MLPAHLLTSMHPVCCRMGALLAALCLLSAVRAVVAAATHTLAAGGSVLSLDHESWDAVIVQHAYPAFVVFGSSAAPLPAEVTDELATLARKLKGIATVATVDCDGDTRRRLCERSESVPRLPHIRIYAAQRKHSPYTQTWYKDFQEYHDVPAARQMAAALQSQLTDDSIARVTSMKEWDNWVDETALPQVQLCAPALRWHCLGKGCWLASACELDLAAQMASASLPFACTLTFFDVNTVLCEAA